MGPYEVVHFGMAAARQVYADYGTDRFFDTTVNFVEYWKDAPDLQREVKWALLQVIKDHCIKTVETQNKTQPGQWDFDPLEWKLMWKSSEGSKEWFLQLDALGLRVEFSKNGELQGNATIFSLDMFKLCVKLFFNATDSVSAPVRDSKPIDLITPEVQVHINRLPPTAKDNAFYLLQTVAPNNDLLFELCFGELSSHTEFIQINFFPEEAPLPDTNDDFYPMVQYDSQRDNILRVCGPGRGSMFEFYLSDFALSYVTDVVRHWRKQFPSVAEVAEIFKRTAQAERKTFNESDTGKIEMPAINRKLNAIRTNNPGYTVKIKTGVTSIANATKHLSILNADTDDTVCCLNETGNPSKMILYARVSSEATLDWVLDAAFGPKEEPEAYSRRIQQKFRKVSDKKKQQNRKRVWMVIKQMRQLNFPTMGEVHTNRKTNAFFLSGTTLLAEYVTFRPELQCAVHIETHADGATLHLLVWRKRPNGAILRISVYQPGGVEHFAKKNEYCEYGKAKAVEIISPDGYLWFLPCAPVSWAYLDELFELDI